MGYQCPAKVVRNHSNMLGLYPEIFESLFFILNSSLNIIQTQFQRQIPIAKIVTSPILLTKTCKQLQIAPTCLASHLILWPAI